MYVVRWGTLIVFQSPSKKYAERALRRLVKLHPKAYIVLCKRRVVYEVLEVG